MSIALLSSLDYVCGTYAGGIFLTMNQDRLDGLLTISVQQEWAKSIKFDEVIQSFKVL